MGRRHLRSSIVLREKGKCANISVVTWRTNLRVVFHPLPISPLPLSFSERQPWSQDKSIEREHIPKHLGEFLNRMLSRNFHSALAFGAVRGLSKRQSNCFLQLLSRMSPVNQIFILPEENHGSGHNRFPRREVLVKLQWICLKLPFIAVVGH